MSAEVLTFKNVIILIFNVNDDIYKFIHFLFFHNIMIINKLFS